MTSVALAYSCVRMCVCVCVCVCVLHLCAICVCCVTESLRIEVWAEGQNQSNVQIRKATYNITLEARQVQLFCKLILHPGDSPVASLAWELQQSRGAKVLVKSSRATDQTVISTPLAVTTSQIVRVAQCIVRTPPKYFEAEWYTVTVQGMKSDTHGCYCAGLFRGRACMYFKAHG